MLILRELLGRLIDRGGLRGRHVADRGAAQLHRRGGIPLDERRRDAETRGDVVEAAARIVGRQVAAYVHRHAEQITDGALAYSAAPSACVVEQKALGQACWQHWGS